MKYSCYREREKAFLSEFCQQCFLKHDYLVIIILPRTAVESMFSQGLYVLKPGISALGNGITPDFSEGESLDPRLAIFFETALCFFSLPHNFGHSIE